MEGATCAPQAMALSRREGKAGSGPPGEWASSVDVFAAVPPLGARAREPCGQAVTGPGRGRPPPGVLGCRGCSQPRPGLARRRAP